MKKISIHTEKLLRTLADRYETCCFVQDDPSCILKRYKSAVDTECAAFIISVLSFGQRAQFMKKADIISAMYNNHPAEWLRSGKWKTDFISGENKFYRFYSYNDMREVFSVLQKMLTEEKTLGDFFRKKYESCTAKRLDEIISGQFLNCRAVCHGKQSANKRVNMFLRWMVRIGSPVDLGLWTWFSPADLIIPLDTHVLAVAKQFGLISASAAGTAKTAVELTEVLKQVWPDDPCKGDFALFGLGINQQDVL